MVFSDRNIPRSLSWIVVFNDSSNIIADDIILINNELILGSLVLNHQCVVVIVLFPEPDILRVYSAKTSRIYLRDRFVDLGKIKSEEVLYFLRITFLKEVTEAKVVAQT